MLFLISGKVVHDFHMPTIAGETSDVGIAIFGRVGLQTYEAQFMLSHLLHFVRVR